MDLIVNNKLSNEVYDKLNNLEELYFQYGDIIFFSKTNIDDAQKGFRYVPSDNSIIDEWAGNEYVIVGYDSTAGFGPEPIIMKVDEQNLPMYHLMTDGGDWKNPDKIANSFDDYIKIMNCISEFSEYFEYSTLSEENYNLLINKISQINSNENMDYWKILLQSTIEQ